MHNIMQFHNLENCSMNLHCTKIKTEKQTCQQISVITNIHGLLSIALACGYGTTPLEMG
jgi:hypothetical protein